MNKELKIVYDDMFKKYSEFSKEDLNNLVAIFFTFAFYKGIDEKDILIFCEDFFKSDK